MLDNNECQISNPLLDMLCSLILLLISLFNMSLIYLLGNIVT